MATLEPYLIPKIPTDIINARSLEVGKQYSGQYLGNNNNYMKFVEAVSTPDVDDVTGLVEQLKSIRIIPKTGEQIYIWTDQDEEYLIINEVE